MFFVPFFSLCSFCVFCVRLASPRSDLKSPFPSHWPKEKPDPFTMSAMSQTRCLGQICYPFQTSVSSEIKWDITAYLTQWAQGRHSPGLLMSTPLLHNLIISLEKGVYILDPWSPRLDCLLTHCIHHLLQTPTSTLLPPIPEVPKPDWSSKSPENLSQHIIQEPITSDSLKQLNQNLRGGSRAVMAHKRPPYLRADRPDW